MATQKASLLMPLSSLREFPCARDEKTGGLDYLVREAAYIALELFFNLREQQANIFFLFWCVPERVRTTKVQLNQSVVFLACSPRV